MSYGLNRAQRQSVASMVMSRTDYDYVRRQMRDMCRENGTNDWDYESNVQFVGWLSMHGWDQLGRQLEKYINGKEFPG